MGEPAPGVAAVAAPRTDDRLQRDPTYERGFQGPHDDGADVAVVDAECRCHREGGENTCLGQTLDGHVFEPGQVSAAVVDGCFLGRAVVLEVHLHAVPVPG